MLGVTLAAFVYASENVRSILIRLALSIGMKRRRLYGGKVRIRRQSSVINCNAGAVKIDAISSPVNTIETSASLERGSSLKPKA